MKKLESEEDAFGHALLAVHKGAEEVHEIVERDDGFVDSMSTRGYFSDYEVWSPVEQEAMQFRRLHQDFERNIGNKRKRVYSKCIKLSSSRRF
jgi:hypothetical protein